MILHLHSSHLLFFSPIDKLLPLSTHGTWTHNIYLYKDVLEKHTKKKTLFLNLLVKKFLYISKIIKYSKKYIYIYNWWYYEILKNPRTWERETIKCMWVQNLKFDNFSYIACLVNRFLSPPWFVTMYGLWYYLLLARKRDISIKELG